VLASEREKREENWLASIVEKVKKIVLRKVERRLLQLSAREN
jgi:hypothetical protein